MILSGLEIKKQVENKNIIIEPFNEECINPNSYNLRLHNELLVYEDHVLDMKLPNKTKKIIIPEEGLILEPGKLYLGRTVEYTKTDKFVPMLEGRSSIGRLGLFIHVTAGFGDIGFSGFWTLEIHCIQPVKIYIESEYVRAVKGGTGLAKCGGNYAASIRSQSNAHAKGYTQVLWLDGVERKYIEEVGTMNVFFKIAGEIVTPALEGSILPGITRDSAIRLLRDKGYTVTERRISIDELVEASDNGSLEEMFGTGTAAVISPVGELQIGEKHIVINDGKIGSTAQWIYDTLTGMQWGKIADPYGWTVEV